MGQKVVFWVKKRCFGVFWTRCEVADLKQRQGTIAMDHRNKIQSLVSPTDGPGDAPDCITEYGPCICEYGRMCHTAPTAQKFGFSLKSTLHLTRTVKKYASHKIWPAALKPQKSPRWALKRVENLKNIFLRKSAIFRSLM